MLKSAYHALGRFERSVCLLKIKSCVADCDLSFSNVVCRTQRHIEGSKPPDLHLFLDLFKPACDMLEEYFRNPVYEPNNRAMQLALEKLLTVLMELDEVEKALKDSQCLEEHEWAVGLSHHYLSKLAVNSSFIMNNQYLDHHSKLTTCDMEGQYGDTSIGNAEAWHGNLDILVGDLPVMLSPDEPTARNGSNKMKIKSQEKLLEHREQMVAQTIVYSFLQQKKHPERKTFLTPFLGISKQHAIFFFYDCKHDMLLESSRFDLQVPGLGVEKSTLLALWLTLNYKYLCSGITVAIKESGFTADFENHAKEKMEIYRNSLRLGCVSSSYMNEYFSTGHTSTDWNIKRSEPIDV